MLHKNTLLFFLALLPALCFAQGQHELKLDLLSLIQKKAFGLSYEYGLNQKVGLELDVKRDYYESSYASANLNFKSQHPDSALTHQFYFLDITIGSNYYFFPKHGIDRYFLGLFWHNSFNTKKDKDWDAFNIEYNGSTSDYPRKWGHSRLGFKGGHKWLIKRHIVIEAEGLIYYELNPISGRGYLDWFLILNVGYRF